VRRRTSALMTMLAGAALALSVAGAGATADSVRVVDGDTIRIGGTTFRLHGIDAPEAGQTCNDASGGSWRCGDEATRHLETLIGDAVPMCDDRGLDDYDRLLSVCTVSGVDINRAMVLDGYAWAFRQYSEDYVSEEETALASGLQIWQAETQSAWDFRASKWDVAEQEAPDGCPIKGNISDNGHVYHAPWSPWYAKTKVSVERGERWFCSERDAIDAGWRAPVWGN
jgi:endonuclease YncB( thermonuclease family)